MYSVELFWSQVLSFDSKISFPSSRNDAITAIFILKSRELMKCPSSALHYAVLFTSSSNILSRHPHSLPKPKDADTHKEKGVGVSGNISLSPLGESHVMHPPETNGQGKSPLTSEVPLLSPSPALNLMAFDFKIQWEREEREEGG